MLTTLIPESSLNFQTSGSFNGPRIPIWIVLCEIEALWAENEGGRLKKKKNIELNSSSQLDLLDEICDDRN